jgi:hypothetical protein
MSDRGLRGERVGQWLLLLCLVAFLVAAVMSGYAISTAQTADSNASRITALEGADRRNTQQQITSSCHRLNVERIATNLNALASYHIDLQLASADTRIDRRLGPLSKIYKTTAALRTWVPLTDCKQALRLGVNYATPASVLFSTRLPSQAALTLGPDN